MFEEICFEIFVLTFNHTFQNLFQNKNVSSCLRWITSVDIAICISIMYQYYVFSRRHFLKNMLKLNYNHFKYERNTVFILIYWFYTSLSCHCTTFWTQQQHMTYQFWVLFILVYIDIFFNFFQLLTLVNPLYIVIYTLLFVHYTLSIISNRNVSSQFLEGIYHW